MNRSYSIVTKALESDAITMAEVRLVDHLSNPNRISPALSGVIHIIRGVWEVHPHGEPTRECDRSYLRQGMRVHLPHDKRVATTWLFNMMGELGIHGNGADPCYVHALVQLPNVEWHYLLRETHKLIHDVIDGAQAGDGSVQDAWEILTNLTWTQESGQEKETNDANLREAEKYHR